MGADPGKTSYWMEPSECSHAGVGIMLQAGVYLAMVTFVGQNGKDEFWRRLFLVRVPEPDSST